jgi:hypothetical protein
MTNSPRADARSGLIAVALFSFSAGSFLAMGVNDFAQGNGRAWLYVGCTVIMVVASVIIGRRTLLGIAPPAVR